MRFRFFYMILLLLFSSIAYSQKKYSPTIVVLDPYIQSYDSLLIDEVKEYFNTDVYTYEEEKTLLDSFKREERNLSLMNLAEFNYRKKMNYGSYYTLGLYGMITYIIFGQTEDCLILPSHEKSDGSLSNLQKIAKKHDVQWVINTVSLNSNIVSNKKYSTAKIQVYDSKLNKIVLDAEFKGDSTNPGFELSCEEGSLNCTFSNILNLSLEKILLTIFK